jgi:hypothetical protein
MNEFESTISLIEKHFDLMQSVTQDIIADYHNGFERKI